MSGNGSEPAGSREAFLKVYEQLRDELVNDPIFEGQPESTYQWMFRMIEYNVPHGKMNRGLAVCEAMKAMREGKGQEVSKEDTFRAYALGWCIEWLQAFFLVSDDIMDNSVTRRGQPCWYRRPEVGMIACNDYIVLDSCLYRILKIHFSSTPYYTQLLDLFHETTHQTAHGQTMDLITAPVGEPGDLGKYTLSTYMRIVTFKTAFYSFYLPVACGMLLAGETDPGAFIVAKRILVKMGQYFQIQDDYLDCFGKPEVIGKIGTDIQDNKCSWLVCKALLMASEDQKQVLQTNYGRNEPACVEEVKSVYCALNLEQQFLDYEQQSYQELLQEIDTQTALPKPLFMFLLDRIYKRNK